ncbi:hypothetical protein FACS1894181_05870 [Bacteroidia bacterium]|nr:hypothetical protein FACS1894181_05870 [Bacteroidia bacterium]
MKDSLKDVIRFLGVAFVVIIGICFDMLISYNFVLGFSLIVLAGIILLLVSVSLYKKNRDE